MESNKNNINNGGDQDQQLPGSSRKRQFNELANDVDQQADQDQQQEPENCSKKNRGGQRGNDALENLHLESLTREELIQLVRKQNEAHKETTVRQAEEFSKRIVQLEQEKAEFQVYHDEHQIGLPTEQKEQMKIQLSLETWYDWLAFVPRDRLSKIVPIIGHRKFAIIVQKFLHEYGEIKIGYIGMVAPYVEDPSGPQPRVRTWKNRSPLRFEMAATQMPANIKNFHFFDLSYFDQSVLNFMQKFQQNGLLDNVNLTFTRFLSKDILRPVLCHILPLINGIVSIQVSESAQLVDIYDAGNSKEIHELNMKMMEKTRFLKTNYDDPEILHTNKFDLYCRWLYQPARADGKPRVLSLGRMDEDYSPIHIFIDQIKQDFLRATEPVTFFIRIVLPKAFQPLEDICLDNGKTKERLQSKMVEADLEEWDEFVLQISRYPLAFTNTLIVGKEIYQKIIYLSEDLRIVPI